MLGGPLADVAAADDRDADHSADSTTAMQLRQRIQELEAAAMVAAGMAHDVSSIAMAILGFAGHIRLDVPPGSELEHAAADIERAAMRVGQLGQRYLAVANRRITPRTRVDVAATVREVVRRLAIGFQPTTEVVVQLEAETPIIIGDAVQLHQVVTNLVVNAAQALDTTPGTITLRLAHRRVAGPVGATPWATPDRPGGEYLLLEVADTGPGIDPLIMARLFEPHVTTRPSGHGIGLATVLAAVDAHRGFIAIDSAPGRGTTFGVHLPLG